MNNPTLTAARGVIASLNDGDTVRVTRDGATSEYTVQRRSSSEPGGFGHPDSASVTVGFGPGRYNFEVTAAGMAAGFYTVERVAPEAPAVDDFWAAVGAQLDLIETERPHTFAAVATILGSSEDHAFFAGSGGDRTLFASLRIAGWALVWAEASYHYVAQHIISGEFLTYVEGDVYPGDAR